MVKIQNNIKKYKKDTGKPLNNTSKGTNILFLPIFLAIVVVPLLVGVYLDELDPEVQLYWSGSLHTAIYDHQSAIMTIIVGIICVGIAFFVFKKQMLQTDKAHKLIIVSSLLFLVFTIISTVFAHNKNLALWGAPDRYEGVFVYISYIILMLYGMTILKGRDIKAQVNLAVIVSALFIAFIGITQLLGKDILFDSPLKNLLTLWTDTTIETADGPNYIKENLPITFGNSNYVGSYMALILPVLVSIVFDRLNSKVMRAIAGVIAILSLAILFASRSQAGMLGVIIASLILILVNLKKITQHKKALITGIVSIAVIFAGLFLVIGVQNQYLVKNIFDEARMLFAKSDTVYDENYGLPMFGFKIEGKDMFVSTVDGNFRMHINQNQEISFFDENDKPIQVTYYTQDSAFVLAEPFQNIAYRLTEVTDNKQGIALEYMGSNYVLLANDFDDGLYTIDTKFNKIEFVHAPHWGFEGKEKLGSSRGYIWSRSIPLLKNTIIKGYGPDNYMVVFPQYDYWAKTYVYNNSQMITDKPHNMYLQWGINNGVVALISLLLVFGIYIFKSGRELFRWNPSDPDRTFKLGLLCAVVGYLATGMFNDSVTSIAPIFWSLLGLGIAMMDVDKKVG